MAELCLESSLDHPIYGTDASIYPEVCPYEPAIPTAHSVNFIPESFQNDGHARQLNFFMMPPTSHHPPPHNPVVVPPGGFIPGQNPRGRPKVNARGDDEEERSGPRTIPKSTKGGGKRSARISEDDADEDMEVDIALPAKATDAQDVSSSVKKKRKTNRYSCPLTGCKETFTRKNDVRRHIQNAAVHRDSAEAIQWQSKAGTTRCKLCNADLSRSDARMRHERTSACGKRTTQKMKDQMIVMRV
ncbi:hypothetical protein L218DRAFT_526096 [Marasmius fiardii PR-910]|nr:hypothetical protein L218DRAFT_526096 [Marasmius fiardii PR-910]